MSEAVRNRLAWIVTAVLAIFIVVFTVTAPDPDEDRARDVGLLIRCPVCQGESIADSPSQSSRDMMDLVRARIDEGLTDEQIIDELLASYSGAALLDPPVGGATLWVWLAPIAAFAVGLVLVARRVRPAPQPATKPDTPAGSAVAGTPAIRPPRSRRRLAIGAMTLVLAAAGALVAVGQFRQDRADDDLFSGVAGGEIDPNSISNETMEAVIAANLDNAEINGMRLALANRYFEERDYQKAFPHYQAVLENDPGPIEGAESYTKLGWMVYDGNGEVDLALSLIENALELAPEDPFARYLKGRVVWCGQSDGETAAAMFEEVLASSALADDVRVQVEADLTAASAGETCE